MLCAEVSNPPLPQEQAIGISCSWVRQGNCDRPTLEELNDEGGKHTCARWKDSCVQGQHHVTKEVVSPARVLLG